MLLQYLNTLYSTLNYILYYNFKYSSLFIIISILSFIDTGDVEAIKNLIILYIELFALCIAILVQAIQIIKNYHRQILRFAGYSLYYIAVALYYFAVAIYYILAAITLFITYILYNIYKFICLSIYFLYCNICLVCTNIKRVLIPIILAILFEIPWLHLLVNTLILLIVGFAFIFVKVHLIDE